MKIKVDKQAIDKKIEEIAKSKGMTKYELLEKYNLRNWSVLLKKDSEITKNTQKKLNEILWRKGFTVDDFKF